MLSSALLLRIPQVVLPRGRKAGISPTRILFSEDSKQRTCRKNQAVESRVLTAGHLNPFTQSSKPLR